VRTPDQHHERHHLGPYDLCSPCRRDQRVCRSKVRFTSSWYAEVHARELNEDYDVDLMPYRCRWCLGWHMTKWRVDLFRYHRRLEARQRWEARNLVTVDTIPKGLYLGDVPQEGEVGAR
jgi:hypothetical protein